VDIDSHRVKSGDFRFRVISRLAGFCAAGSNVACFGLSVLATAADLDRRPTAIAYRTADLSIVSRSAPGRPMLVLLSYPGQNK